jgi:hypothetical protein
VKKLSFRWLSASVVLAALVSVVVSTGCGPSAPPPAPAIDEAPTEEYIEGEGSYYNQGAAAAPKKKTDAKKATESEGAAKKAAGQEGAAKSAAGQEGASQ